MNDWYGSIECLGHNIVDQTVRTQEDKIQAVRDTPRPTTKRQMKSFLGLEGFYCRFIPIFSSIASPLTDLTKRIDLILSEIGKTSMRKLSRP